MQIQQLQHSVAAHFRHVFILMIYNGPDDFEVSTSDTPFPLTAQ